MTRSYLHYCLLYAGFYLAMLISISLIVGVLGAFAPALFERLSDGAGTGVGIAAALIPVMLVAQRFFRNEQRQLSKREGWLLALLFMILGFMVSMVLFLGIMAFNGIDIGVAAQVLADSSLQYAFVIGVYAIVLVLLNKLMLWAGIRTEIKKAARLAAKEDYEG